MSMNSNELISDIKKYIKKENVLTSAEDCQAYSADAFLIKEQTKPADVVVLAETVEDVQNIVKLANKYKIPVICRGAGTNVVGACRIVQNAGIILDFSKMNKILRINKENMTATVQPGVVVGDLQKEVEKLGLFYPPDPSNLDISTIGGSIAMNSGGAKSFKYGTTKDYVLDMKVVMSDGRILRTGSQTIKNSTGYNLNSLFVGSEGTLGIVVEAVLRLIVKPESKRVIMAYFDSVKDAVMAVNAVIEQHVYPTTIDFMDNNAIRTVEKFYPAGLLTDKEAMLLIEIDGFKNSMDYQEKLVRNVLEKFVSHIEVSHNDDEYEKIWSARRTSMKACAQIKPDVTTDDLIVPRENLEKLVLGIRDICDKYGLVVCMIGHIGDGSVHPQIPIDFQNETEYKNYKAAKVEMYDLTASLGGILSGEHGIGMEKRPYINKVVDYTGIEYMKNIKQLFDPNNILNPHKIF